MSIRTTPDGKSNRVPRRQYLTAVATAVAGGVAGCAGDGSDATADEPTAEPTATEARPSTTTEMTTSTSRFEAFTDSGFNGEVMLGNDPLARINLEGSLASSGNLPLGGIRRTEALQPPFEVTFGGVTIDRQSVQNGINVGISAFESPLFRAESRTPYASVRSEEGRAGPTEFVLELSAEDRSITVESDPFTVSGNDTDIEIVHTGDRVRALIDDSEVASLEYGISQSFFPAVTLEDDADISEGASLTVTSYAESEE